MKQQVRTYAWLMISVFIVGCNEQGHEPKAGVLPEINTSLTMTDSLNKTIVNVSTKGLKLEKRLDNEPSLACQMSYKITAKAVSMQAGDQPPLKGVPAIKLAKFDVFMRDCLELPRKLQKCLVDQYAFKHIDSCRQARKEYDGRVKNARSD